MSMFDPEVAREIVTDDGHIALSDNPRVPMPPRFSAPDTGAFVPQPWGHEIGDDADADD